MRQPRKEPPVRSFTIQVGGGGHKHQYTIEDRSWYNAKVRARREFRLVHPHVDTLIIRKVGESIVTVAKD